MRLLYGAPPRPPISWPQDVRTPFAPEPDAPPAPPPPTETELLERALRRLGRIRMKADLNVPAVRAELDALAGELLSLQALKSER